MGTLTTKAVQLARGAAAGTMATVAMKGVMSLLESKNKTSIKDAFQDRQPAEEAIVDRLNKRYKWKMSRPGRTILSRGLRLAIGAGTGAASSYLSQDGGRGPSVSRGGSVGDDVYCHRRVHYTARHLTETNVSTADDGIFRSFLLWSSAATPAVGSTRNLLAIISPVPRFG